MRIVSLNAWGGAMLDPLIRWLRQTDADVVCLQEVTRIPGVHGWTEFSDGERTLPQRANLLDDLRDVLPNHMARFAVSDAGPVSTDAGATHRRDRARPRSA